MVKENNNQKERRDVVIPGEVVATGDVLPGDWTIKEGDNIISTRLGIADTSGKIARVIPISGVYIPRRGNVVIAQVLDFTMKGWIMNINAPYDSFLTLNECPMFVRENEMEDVHDIGDLIVAKISKTGRTSVDLTIKGRGLGKIKDGIAISVNPNRVPRVIGKEGSMVNLIKNASNCEITVGQNGLIWIKGETTDGEVFAKNAIEFVVENTISIGLTDKVEAWLKSQKVNVGEKKERKLNEAPVEE